MGLVTCPDAVLGYKTQRRLGAVIEQLLHLILSPLLYLFTMPLENTRLYRHARGHTIARPRFPTPELGVLGYPYERPAEVRVLLVVLYTASKVF